MPLLDYDFYYLVYHDSDREAAYLLTNAGKEHMERRPFRLGH